MRFEIIKFANLFWLVIAAAMFLFWRRSKKDSIRRQFASAGLIPEISHNLNKQEEIFRIWLITLSLIFITFALMRPQWGFEWREIKKQGLDILVALDTSNSMLTEDVKPNRLERSKLAVKDLVKKLDGDRVGLITFSGTGFLICPLTSDYNGFLMTLESSNTKTMPQGGTAIAEGIEEAIRTYKKTRGKYKALIIITDGEDLEGRVVEAAKKAKEEDIKIYCIGIGTKEGELIRVQNDKGEYEFLKDNNGNFVKSRLNEGLLEQIASITQGIYVKTTGAEFGLDVIYEEHLSKMEKHEIKSTMEKRYYERFQIPLAIALIFLLGETLLGVRKLK